VAAKVSSGPAMRGRCGTAVVGWRGDERSRWVPWVRWWWALRVEMAMPKWTRRLWRAGGCGAQESGCGAQESAGSRVP
jgi:hypothetical protein